MTDKQREKLEERLNYLSHKYDRESERMEKYEGTDWSRYSRAEVRLGKVWARTREIVETLKVLGYDVMWRHENGGDFATIVKGGEK